MNVTVRKTASNKIELVSVNSPCIARLKLCLQWDRVSHAVLLLYLLHVACCLQPPSPLPLPHPTLPAELPPATSFFSSQDCLIVL